MPIIEARKLKKFYQHPEGGRIQVIASIDLAVFAGQILAPLGPPGCGESALHCLYRLGFSRFKLET